MTKIKTCNKGHRHSDEYCKVCQRNRCAARYQRKREGILAKAKAQREEYKQLKAAALAATQIAATQ